MKLSIYSRPPERISKEIGAKIREIEKVFGKNRSSKAPLPHLTLRSSFQIPKKDFKEICGVLRDEFRLMKKPLVKINGWATAPLNHKWIFGFHLNVEDSKELREIHKRLERLFPNYKTTYKIDRFVPHISLAWNMKKDMEKEDFDKTVKHLKRQKFKFRKQYKLDRLFIHEEVGRDRYRFVKVIK